MLLDDEDGYIRGSYDYDPYGNTEQASGYADTPLRFGGQYQDDETGLIYLRARYQDPATNQFLTVDPIVAQTRSAYGYANNDGVNAGDPTGLICFNNPFNRNDNCVSMADQYSAVHAFRTGAAVVAATALAVAGGAAIAAAGTGTTAAAGGVTGVETAGGAASATATLANARYFASLQQLGSAGVVIAGPGCKTPFRDAAFKAARYGGNAADYVKKASGQFQDATGRIMQTHWIENVRTGVRYEEKTKLMWPGGK